MTIYNKCAEFLDQGKNIVLVTVIEARGGSPARAGFKLISTEDEQLYGSVGGGALENRAIEEAKTVFTRKENYSIKFDLKTIGMQCGGYAILFFEYIQAAKDFILFGGGHVGRALVPVIDSLGFNVTIFDIREDIKKQVSNMHGIDIIIGDYQDISPVAKKILSSGYCFIATHGHLFDNTVLSQLLTLKADFKYLGMIGSSSKVKSAIDKMQDEKLTIPDTFFSPAGIQIGADSPAEIAVSVAAELIALTYNVPVNNMRLKR